MTRAWHREAWNYYDHIGELRFGINWISNAMSRVNLVAARPATAAGDEPTPIDLNDPEILPVHRRAAELVSMIAHGPAGQGQMLGAFGIHLSVVGVGYLIVEPPMDDLISDRFTEWTVLSAEEVRRSGEGDIEIRVSETEWRTLHPNGLVLKVWRRHPRKSWESDSPVRGTLSVLREIDLLERHIQATAQSRLAGAGLLAMPSEAVFPPGQGFQASQGVDPDDEDLTPPEDNFVETLIETMMVPLQDPGSAASVVPLVVKMPGELVSQIKHISFATPFDDRAKDLLDNAIGRLALGLDIPPEVLTGTGGMNHWGAWQVAEEAITLHVEPLTETVSHALTMGFLHPALLAEGFDPEEALIWYDTSDLRTRPDKSANAVAAFDRNALSKEALLREMGLSVEDLPSDEERREQILLSVVRGAPSLAPPILEDLGYLESSIANAQADPQVEGAEIPAIPAPAVESAPQGPPSDDRAIVASALSAACDIIVRRALERAGARLRSAAGKGQPGGAASIPVSDPGILHTVLDASAHSDFGTLLEGAWTMVPEVADRYGFDADSLTQILDTYTRALLASGQEHRYGRLAVALGTP